MNLEFGPFSVNPAQIAGLGGAVFQELINRLLDTEVASAGLNGIDLHTSYKANVGDKGVDAALYSSTDTEWVPAGDSAWQFKAGDLGPESCASELEGAGRAHEILRQGGKYRLVLGKSLEDYLIAAREDALRVKAQELGFDPAGDRFRIIAGDRLAAWIERHPQLSVSRILGGIGNEAIAFDKWQQSNAHQSTWVASTDRDELKSAVAEFLDDPERLELRIEGASGLGKTRGVLESLRGSKYESLILYIGDPENLKYPLIDHLTQQKRSAIVVVDECTRQRHNILAQQLVHQGPVKLITVGERDTRIPQTRPVRLSPLPSTVIDEVLAKNRPSLWPEARRVVVANCAGNVRWALYMAEEVLGNPRVSVGALIDAQTWDSIVSDLLTGQADFLALSALALFSRYGLERDALAELKQIAGALEIPLTQLTDANRRLEQLGFVTKHGRFRAVTPQPLAVFLATSAWEVMGDRILGSLLPAIDDSLAERLFLRAADLGSSGPAAVAVNRLLGEDGPFRSLESIAEGRASRLLTQLAIICPEETALHVSRLIEESSDQELRELKSIRRSLVWSLEKLVWHSSTFVTAADSLLRLALCENETWSNNSIGTWVSLFAAMLPATAASPSARMTYLQRVALDERVEVRQLAAQAAKHALDTHGTVMVSGELQGGVIVEPRGVPDTYGDLWDYIRSAISLLRRLAVDSDPSVQQEAEKALVGAIHPYLEIEIVRDTLFDALATLPDDSLRRVRTEIKHLYALFASVEKPDFPAVGEHPTDLASRRAGLDLLNSRLPQASPSDELSSLAFAQRWEWEDNELQAEILRVARALPIPTARELLLGLLRGTAAPASFELGAALHVVDASQDTEAFLSETAAGGNLAGLVGYLHAALNDGDTDAFDSFLDGHNGKALDPATLLSITVRGPQSEAGWLRVMGCIESLPVHVSAPRIFGWHVDLGEDRIAALLDAWLPRIESQEDYNFAVDAVSMMLHRRGPLDPKIEAGLVRLTEMRSKFPEVGQEGWDWVQLARRRLAQDATGLLLDLVAQVDAGSVRVWEGHEERKLLREAIEASGPSSLDKVMALVEAGSWRVQMDFRGWLADAYATPDLVAWVGEDVERARLVADMTAIGGTLPSDTVRFLLDKFGSDEQLSASLYSDLVSGTWWGNESERLTKQINQLDEWLASPIEPAGARAWARAIIATLKRRREQALERESEEDR